MSEEGKHTEESLFQRVKEYFLQEEIDAQQSLEKKVDLLTQQLQEFAKLKQEVDDPERFEKMLQPYFDEHLQYVKTHFPDLFKPMLHASIQAHLKEAQSEVIDAIYPIMGRLIKKYIIAELEKLSQQIDRQLDQAFSFKSLWRRVSAFFSGVKQSEIIMYDGTKALLEEVFIIQQKSGLLLGHYSVEDHLNSDMVAGMLTGIRGFVEHAFAAETQKLEVLQYEHYKIIVHDFHSFYFACLIEGKIDETFKERLKDTIDQFYESYPFQASGQIDAKITDQISANLTVHFNGFNKVDQ